MSSGRSSAGGVDDATLALGNCSMPAYVIVDTLIHDPERYEEYKQLARPIAERYGGEYLVRGAEIDLIDHELWTPTRIVILRFPDRGSPVVSGQRRLCARQGDAPRVRRLDAVHRRRGLIDGD